MAGARAVVRSGAFLRGGVDDLRPAWQWQDVSCTPSPRSLTCRSTRSTCHGDDVARLRVGMGQASLERAGDRARGGLRPTIVKRENIRRRSTGRLRDDPELHRRGAPDRRHPVRDDDQRPEGGRPGAVLQRRRRSPTRSRGRAASTSEPRSAIPARGGWRWPCGCCRTWRRRRVADQTEGRSIAQCRRSATGWLEKMRRRRRPGRTSLADT